jgi:hypothetical protein
MNRLMKIVGLGMIIWAVTLPWLEFNRFLMSPVVFGALISVIPAYFLGQHLDQRRHKRMVRPARLAGAPTRPTVIFQTAPQSAAPTRPALGISARRRAGRQTLPMPVLHR